MIELGIFALLVIVLLGASFYNRHKLRVRRAEKTQRGIQQLTAVLSLIQRLQRHRGLCANLNDSNRAEQQQLSHEINQHWSPLLDRNYGGNVKRVNIQHNNWQKIETQPLNSFMAHCDLIEKLLHELTVIADTCSLTADNNNHDTEELWQNLLQRPHFAETLGRLRALGTKAAASGQCSADVRVQLQYQLQNLDKETIDRKNDLPIKTMVNDEILTPDKIVIDSRVYFNNLTNAIDNQIQITREYLEQLK
ncbi:MAG: hypothetical protein ACPGAE_09380 [Neptuniibacter sp.]